MIRKTALAASIATAGSLLLLVQPASAQQASQSSSESGQTTSNQQEAASSSGSGSTVNLDTVQVTGTRISNPNVVSPGPISTLTSDDIKATGAVNLGDVLTTMPQLAATYSMGNSGRFIGIAGVGMQNLRNLGFQRTLVLINGRRVVPGASGYAAVDTNMIPAAWIERVEVITGGASAVYGADAVSGVVNFILKKQFEGLALSGQYGDSEHGGFQKKSLSGAVGWNFAQDRGNVALSLEHSRNNTLWYDDRFGDQSWRAVRTPGSGFDNTLLPNAGTYYTTPGGTFSTGAISNRATRYVFDPDGSVRRQQFNGAVDNAGNCADCDAYNPNQVAQLQPKYSRSTLNAVASFDINENNRLYFEGSYNKVHVKTYFAPVAGAQASNTPYWIEPDNAYVTPALAAIMGGAPIRVSRTDLEGGRRGEDTDRDNARVVLGAEGVISGDWTYDASLNYGRTRDRRDYINNRVNERFYAGLDAVVDPASGQIVCRSRIDPGHVNLSYANNKGTNGIISPDVAAGCVPFNVFGAGAIDPAAMAWYNTTTTARSRITQFVASGTITNNTLFELPAGPVSLGTGFEYRRETSRDTSDPLDAAGQTILNASPGTSGSFNVREVWAETAVPLLSDLPGVKSLAVGAAARYSDYDTIGSTRAWRWNIDWAVADSLRIRGNMSAAVRAPNINELFSGQGQAFGSVADPCDATNLRNARNPALRASNCAALGVPANFIDQVAVNDGLSGGNPDLKPETGRSWTAGFVFTPGFLPGFGVNADYWDIKLTDAINTVGFQTIADRCVDTPAGIDNQYCRATQRNADGQIVFMTSIALNMAALETRGVDLQLYYDHALWGGKMRWGVNATRTLEFTTYPFQNDTSESTSQNGTAGYPEWKANFSANYQHGNWNGSWNTRFLSSTLRVSNESYRANPTSTTPIRAGSGIAHDIRGAYTFGQSGWQAFAGITNLFDSDPPVDYYGLTSGSGLYETLGRSYYAGFNYRFQ